MNTSLTYYSILLQTYREGSRFMPAFDIAVSDVLQGGAALICILTVVFMAGYQHAQIKSNRERIDANTAHLIKLEEIMSSVACRSNAICQVECRVEKRLDRICAKLDA